MRRVYLMKLTQNQVKIFFSPVEKQLITVKGEANFALEQSGTTYCNLLCVS